MSYWTRVRGVVCFFSTNPEDKEKDIDPETIFGKECLPDSPKEVWDDLSKHPGNYLPSGSEGTLRTSVLWNDKDAFCTDCAISLTGNLRDFTNVKWIISWFKDKVRNAGFPVSGAIITVRSDTERRVWSMSDRQTDRDCKEE